MSELSHLFVVIARKGNGILMQDITNNARAILLKEDLKMLSAEWAYYATCSTHEVKSNLPKQSLAVKMVFESFLCRKEWEQKSGSDLKKKDKVEYIIAQQNQFECAKAKLHHAGLS